MKELLNSGRDNRVIITLQNENVIWWESMHKWLHILLLCHLSRWIFKLPHHLHVHLIVFAKSAYCNSTDEGPGPKRFGEELKAQDGNFFHYFLLNIPLLTFQSATQPIRIFFPVIFWITYCTGYSYVEAWFGHCITSVQYSHFCQRWIPLGLALRMQDCL